MTKGVNEKFRLLTKEEIREKVNLLLKRGVMNKFETITRDELRRKIDIGGDFVLLDMRSAEDYKEGHLISAISVPLENIAGEIAKHHLDKTKETIVYCGSSECSVSTEGAEKLYRLGFINIKKYAGGFKEWKEAGFPVESNVACSCASV